MEKLLKIAVVLTAYDKMTRVVKDATDSSRKMMNDAFSRGGAMLAAGATVIGALTPAIQAYAELEDSSVRLKTAMMEAGGKVSQFYSKVNELAVSLGDKLPGTTADFQNMFEVMLNSGIKAETILGGVGKSAAYLAVALKMPYDEAGKFAAKMKEATGVADAEMLKFMDVIARTKNLGIETGEMQYAFGRSAGSLKLLGIQGLEASKSMAALYAMFIRSGLSGETAGTGFASIMGAALDPKKMAKMNEEAAKIGMSFNFFKDGKFVGIENMIAQLDKLKTLSADKRAGIVNALTGGGQDAQMLQTLISNGIEGFNKINEQMQNQATLSAKVEAQLGTLKNIWEATTGTITNLLAALGEALAPELKAIADLIGKAAGALRLFVSSNPILFKFIATFAALSGGVLMVAGGIAVLSGAFAFLNTVMLANPIVLTAVAVAALIAAIYTLVVYWKEIYNWWSKSSVMLKILLAPLVVSFGAIIAIAKAIRLLIDNWDLLTTTFNKVTGFLSGFGDTLYNAGANIINSIWEGMKAMVNKPIDLISEMTKKIREYLPFSPAKQGALKDIHRIRLVETIAEGIKPASLLSKMNTVTKAVFDFKPSGNTQFQAAGVGGGGNATVNFNVSFNGSATKESADAFVNQLRQYQGEIARMVNDATNQRNRSKF